MTPVLVGENNTYSARPDFALFPVPATSAGGRLHAMLSEGTGLSRTQYIRTVDRVNVSDVKKGERWDSAVAREGARRVLERYQVEIFFC